MPKGLPWFRLYAEFAFDPKIQSLPETLQRRYAMFLCLKCNGDIPGLTDETAACALRISINDLLETKKMLISIGLICENFEINNWEKRQYRSDSSTERVKLFRSKKLNVRGETLRKRYRNGNVTPLSVSVSESVSGSKSVLKKKSIPPNIDDVKEYIKSKGYSVDSEKWYDFYQGKGWMIGKNKMVDWQAAVRTWNRGNEKQTHRLSVPERREEVESDPVQKFLDNFPEELISIRKEFEEMAIGDDEFKNVFDDKLIALFSDDHDLLVKFEAHKKLYPQSDERTYRKNYLYAKYGIPEVENG